MTIRSKSYFTSLFVTGYVVLAADMQDLVDSYADAVAIGMSPCNFDAVQAPVAGGGAYATGRQFYPGALLTAVGARFYWNGPSSTILCSLWNPSGTKVATGSVSVTSTPGIFEAIFGSPYAFQPSDMGTSFIVSMSESTGTDHQNQASSTLIISGMPSAPGLVWGASFYSSGVDTFPVINTDGGGYIIEPVFG